MSSEPLAQRSSLADRLPIIAFIAGIAILSFGYGIAAGIYQLFPYDIVQRAITAGQALQEERAIPANPYALAVEHDKAGVTIHDPARSFDGYTFVTGFRDGEHKAMLLDMDGNVRHEWSVLFSAIWQDPPHRQHQNRDDLNVWHGAHLFPNGDILFNFESGGFPNGGGLVRLDKDSNVVWALPRNTHHDVHVAEDGMIYAASQHYHTEGLDGVHHLEPPYYEDTVLKIAPDGEVLDEFSILRALQESDFRGLLSVTYDDAFDAERRVTRNPASDDPTHLNSVDVLPAAWAARFPLFEAGDLLVSLRNINSVLVIDPDTRQAKWAMTGLFVRQHDAEFLANGNILLFDNRLGTGDDKRSQILEIDPVAQRVVWRYQGDAEHPFFSNVRGKQQQLPNGNILVTDSESGRLFEVTREPEPRIAWEYYNRLTGPDDQDKLGLITLGQRLAPEALTFIE